MNRFNSMRLSSTCCVRIFLSDLMIIGRGLIIYWSRKLSLNYLQLSASEARYRDDDDRRRGRRSRKREVDTSYNSLVNMSDYPLSKNEINKIRRSQVLHYAPQRTSNILEDDF